MLDELLLIHNSSQELLAVPSWGCSAWRLTRLQPDFTRMLLGCYYETSKYAARETPRKVIVKSRADEAVPPRRDAREFQNNSLQLLSNPW